MDINSLFGPKYLSSYEYVVTIGLLSIPVSKVSNLVSSIEAETIEGNGDNAGTEFAKKKSQSTSNLIIEGAVTSLDMASTSLLGMMEPGVYVNEMYISILSGKLPVAGFMIQRGIVVKVSYSDLEAGQSGILKKTVEIKHNGIQRI